MIPLIPFPLEKLKLTPLYIDQAELEKIRQASSAPAPLSKGQAGYHDLYFPEPPEERPYYLCVDCPLNRRQNGFPDNPTVRLWHAPTISIRGAP